MMQTKYDEPWESGKWMIGCNGCAGFEVVAWFASNAKRRTEHNQRRADRAVACVNVLAGVPDPAKLIEALDALIVFWDATVDAGVEVDKTFAGYVDSLRAARGPKGVGK
jgi:hypothetical protein